MAVITGSMLAALQYDKLPIFTVQRQQFSAYFAESSGLRVGDHVQVLGLEVGQITGVELDGARVLVRFEIGRDIELGDRTEAAIRARSLLGAKLLEVTPRGDSPLSGPIPLERTLPAYQLPDALGQLAETIEVLDTDRLNESLTVLADTFRDSPADLKAAIDGVGRFSASLNERDAQLRDLLADSSKVTAVLRHRTDQIADLIGQSNSLLTALQSQSSALDQLSANISGLSRQLTGFVADNRAQFRSALEKLDGVLAIIDGRKARVQKSISLLNAYAMSLGEAVSSGPFFKALVANLLPGQFVQPFVDAAFADLGLDPNVLPPSELNDPQTGQQATPALPVPYPRTGQGGEPRLTLPDAITGNQGDSRYPYREPLPAPPPGGSPPGPPAPEPAEGP